ncbi:MAG: Fe-S cluster assembly protein SufD [Gemmatimonadales bacterium]|nr:Fe-S cluster assembly protein SufD [Gemmatimonadales bacterium]
MTLDTYRHAFQRFTENGGGSPSWIRPLREAGLDRFVRAGFPTRKNEDWRFTNLQPIATGEFRLLDPPEALPGLDALRPYLFGHEDWPRMVFVNGRFVRALSRLDGIPSSVQLLSLREALDSQREVVEAHLAKVAVNAPSAFTDLNTAFMADGALLVLPADAVLEHPVHLVFVTAPGAADGATHPRTLIVAGRHAQATVVESYVSLAEQRYLTNTVSEIFLEEGARVNHCKVQLESEAAYHVGTIEAWQGRSSHFESFSFAMGGALSRTNVYTVLDGEGSHVQLDGLYVGHGVQHLDHQTRIEHAKPGCTSREIYKGMLDDRSHAVFNGKVYVRAEAQQTDGKQTNRNLLLSETAKVDTKPQLEIFADDVKCTHGATVGQLDELALFYCQTRGIPLSDARTMVTYAFAADVIEEIQTRPVAEHLEALVRERLERGSARAE